ncbi:MAG: hypothetical protein DKINENOH_01654 [bacterium]|nr:hypothetical protein [bacterium]
MDPTTIKDWLVPISTFITLITVAIGSWLSLREYRLKVRAETRIAHSSELESDIKLIKLFIEIMDIAHSRRGTQVSEKAVEAMLSPEVIKELGLSGSSIRDVLNNAVISLPVGVAAQDAAISAIWVLGNRHAVLKPIAIQGLTTLNTFKGNVTEKYLQDLISKSDDEVLAAIDRHP